MKIMVNDVPMEIDADAKVDALVQQLGLKADRVAVLRNGDIVERSLFESTPLAAGDVVDLVQFVPGG